MKDRNFSPEKKDKIKIVRSILEGIILITLLIIAINAFLNFSVYKTYSLNNNSKNRGSGFIAVSYFGVDRIGNDTLIKTESLEKQIEALKDNGYVTITQKDIIDCYVNGKVLPENALFLFFEDGRRDTAIFSQKILEKYNYKATMLTYADKFSKKDSKFLMPEELVKLQNSSYWELGTNGYRLEYINVFDKDMNYLGDLDSVEFSNNSYKINRYYNHYLMDYIRDEHGIPIETYEEMEKRISNDYKSVSNIYKKEIEYLPCVYALMHSNTGKFGTNDKVSEVNEKWIKELFTINFNREGNSLNSPQSSIYDLTRVQPQAYWSTNHLLMRVWDDTKKDIKFVVGDEKKADKFKKVKGQAEFKDDTIILTSLPKDKGLVKLLNSENYKNVKIASVLKGNVIGSQAIYLRANEDRSNSICVQLINNVVNIVENLKGNKNILFALDLNGDNKDSKIDIKKPGNKKVNITLVDNKLSLIIDENNIVNGLKVNIENEGSIFLESAWGEYGYSQRNISDDVYDGVFEKFKVTDINNKILYDSTLKGVEAIKYEVETLFNKIVNWFVKYL